MSKWKHLPIFQNTELGNLRVVMKDGEAWFVLKDVCDILGLSNPSKVAERLDDDEKSKLDPKSKLGSKSNEPINVVNEPGLYSVVLKSDKPIAKKFKRWITHEVLPSIRKEGKYELGQKNFIKQLRQAVSTIQAKLNN
jgi:anti-repressor protein